MQSSEDNWIKAIQQINNNEVPDAQLMAQLSNEELELIEALLKDQSIAAASSLLSGLDENEAWAALNIQPIQHRIRLWPKLFKYAAMFLLPVMLLGAGILYYLEKTKPVPLAMASLMPTDHKRATLVLSDGREVELSKNTNQALFEDAGTSIVSKNEELLSYQQKETANKSKQVFNKLMVPRGAEYKLALADGTIVMINSASVIRFPVNINDGDNRDVYLEEGEAYFKVAKNPSKPFIVHANGMDVQVLGTEFNVNTYTGNIKTTLVQGKVAAKGANNQQLILNPNQQAVFNKENSSLTKSNVDVTPDVAWANGKIVFEEASLAEVMQTLGRWYDYDVEFETEKMKKIRFSAEIERYKDIKTVLNIMEQTGGVQFRIKNRRIYVDQQ